MSIFPRVSNALPQYQVPATPKAKLEDERTESAAVKEIEAVTGKDGAVPSKPSGVKIKA
jgi:hypothetical protein